MRKTLVYIAMMMPIAAIVFVGATNVQAGEPSNISEPDVVCSNCHAQGDQTLVLPDGQLSLRVEPSQLAGSVHKSLQCTSCHASIVGIFHPAVKADSLRAYQLSQETLCLKCHTSEGAQMKDNIHRQHGTSDVASCTDCHGAHDVKAANTASFKLASVATCTGCHGDKDMMAKYHVSTAIPVSYFQDFHGKTAVLEALQGGNTQANVAVCTDCHGVHNIQKVDAANSMVSQNNLPNTCGQCHPGATAQFTSAWLYHREPSLTQAPAVFFARWFYRIMIPFVVVGLLAHVLLDARRSFSRRKGEAK